MDKVFDYLKEIFNKNNFRLYMIGSSSRDYLLHRKIKDYDFVTDATPKEIKKFLDCDMTFSRFGSVKYKVGDIKVDIVTLREESEYKDNRHPSKIKFIKDIYIDYKRRDFTINAIYIDEDYNIIDPSKLGVKDLENRRLRFIKDTLTSITEDPLRIIRCRRFIKEYNLILSDDDLKLINRNACLINRLNPEKVKEEYKKDEEIWSIN